MKLQLVSKDVAILAKEVGFINRGAELWRYKGSLIESDGYEIAPSWVEETISRPTQELLAKWLRDIHNIDTAPLVRFEGEGVIRKVYRTGFAEDKPISYNSYEDCHEATLKLALEHLKFMQTNSK